MNVGDLVRRSDPKAVDTDAIGFVTAIQFSFDRGHPVIFVRFPANGWGQWFHPTKLELINEV